jgi:hypothetical protein
MMVVVDKFSKLSHFIPLKHPISALVVAKAFMQRIPRYTTAIISYRDIVFTSLL